MKKLILCVALALICIALASCGGEPGPKPPAMPAKTPIIRGDAVIVFGANSAFDIVYGTDKMTSDAASSVATAVQGLGLKAPELFADTGKEETQCELLIGDTSRALSAEAKALVEANVETDPYGKHWVYLYKNGQLAIYANGDEAYALAVSELTEKYYKAGEITVKSDMKSIGHVEGPHKAYMEYDIPDNYYEGYTDPFSVSEKNYKKMTLKLLEDGVTYRISYKDELGGTFSQDFVKKDFGMYMMGMIAYTEKNGVQHKITSSSTDHEFVLRIGAKTAVTTRSGAHGAYPKDKTWEYYEDDTSYYNDRMLDMTFYDGKSGQKLDIENIGNGIVTDGLRIVIHHNVYELNYTQDNVLVNSVREYLYNGYDILFDARLYITQDVMMKNSMSAMLPISKQYGNCAMFYKPDGTTVYMKTPLSNTKDETVMGVEAYVIDLWGENNPKYHMTLTLNTPEDQLMNSAVGSTSLGYTGFREMLGGSSNKIYCSFMSSDTHSVAWGEEFHFNTTWSFSIQKDFRNPSRQPDYWVGLPKEN